MPRFISLIGSRMVTCTYIVSSLEGRAIKREADSASGWSQSRFSGKPWVSFQDHDYLLGRWGVQYNDSHIVAKILSIL